MKYFAVFLPVLDKDLSQQHRPAHLKYLDELDKLGYIFAKGRFVDGAGGLVIYKGLSYDHVELLVQRDPYVVHKARSYEIHEWDMSVSEVKI